MNQSRTDASFPFYAIFFLVLCGLFLSTSCDRSNREPAATQASAPATTQVATPRIASLVPAATDLLLAMGARDRLVAVSNFDLAADVQALPRVGDYQQIDWEALAAARPTTIVVEMQPDRMPAGLIDRATSLHANVVNVTVEQLTDVYVMAIRLGALVGEPGAGGWLAASLQSRIEKVSAASAGRPRVSTLLTVDVDPKSAVGRGPFLDELLTAAGGENVVPASYPHWPTLDAETLASLKPAVVIALLPNASPQAVQQAKANLSRIAWPAPPRVIVLTEPTLLQPGSHVADLAEEMASVLADQKKD